MFSKVLDALCFTLEYSIVTKMLFMKLMESPPEWDFPAAGYVSLTENIVQYCVILSVSHEKSSIKYKA